MPNDFVSEQSWSGVVANSTKDLDLFYFKVEEAGLYYLDELLQVRSFIIMAPSRSLICRISNKCFPIRMH